MTFRVTAFTFYCRCLAVTLLIVVTLLSTLASGSEKYGGWRLAAESSPYLRLHADNPVEWYPWGEEAFEKARKENKPLFISIGYFTCHWCHVMARESFSNLEIARQLNDGFIVIKVDREQRPDVDAAYMQYVMMTRGQGGWPMSVWATPSGAPFFGGTYFPPEAGMGQPGLKQILDKLTELWQADEVGIRKAADEAVATLQKMGASSQPLTRLTDEPLIKARQQYIYDYDELQGGFGAAPKFPQPARLLFLLQDEKQASADMALFTLDKMVEGGIYDQLAGGFHRYSVDHDWRVPHFEKMLYDQALIARAYVVAYRRTKDNKYADTARQVLDFTLAEMRDKEGGFYSALSADSPAPSFIKSPVPSSITEDTVEHMEEGAYYTWSWRQLNEAINDKVLRNWAAERYGVTEQGNALIDPLGEMVDKNVLYRAQDTKALAKEFKVDIVTANQRNADVDKMLLRARSKRPVVPVDDKVVTVWNGYMITTLAMAGRLLDEPRYIQAAEATAKFVLGRLYDEQQGVLFRDWRDGERGVPGFSEDYAGVAEGLLALYKVTGNKRWLNRASELVDVQLEKFWDNKQGGFFSTASDTELWLREKEASDGATLATNGISLHALHQLGKLTGHQKYQQKAWQTAAWVGAQLGELPAAMPYSLIVWQDLPAAINSQESAK